MLPQAQKYFSNSIVQIGYRCCGWRFRNISNSTLIDTKDEKKGKQKFNENDGNDGIFTDTKSDINVAIIGGGLTPVYTAIILKQYKIIKRIHLIDPKDTLASAILDVSHIDTSTRIKYFKDKNMREALKQVNIIALMDEVDFEMGKMDFRDQFKITLDYVRRITEQMVKFRPEALVAVFIRPVTATLAMVSEIYKCSGWWDPDRIIGSTTMECMRLETMTARLLDLNPAFFTVPIVGGADANTIVPLLSRAKPINQFTATQENTLQHYLHTSDKEIAATESKGPKMSAAVAAAKLILTLTGGLLDLDNVVSCAYVRSNVLPSCRFFTTELQFGPGGVKKNFGLPKVLPTEISLIDQAIPLIGAYVDMAVNAVRSNKITKLNV